MSIGKFDTDSKALAVRIETHEKYGSADLNEWILSHIQPNEGDCILELGSGTGKQTLLIAKIVGKSGKIVAVDASKESMDFLLKSADDMNLKDRIKTFVVKFDEMEDYLKGFSFDRVLASYSIYYAKEVKKIFKLIHEVIKPGGLFFFCGPSRENNIELVKFHYGLLGKPIPKSNPIPADFMEKNGKDIAKNVFKKVDVFTFENTLRIGSPKALYDYWKSYNLYDENIKEAFKKAATEHFKNHEFFETVKRAIGIRAIK